MATRPSQEQSEAPKHVCNCKRSKCRKKYCECFQAGVACSASCKCIDCENDGSLPRPRNYGVHDWMLPKSAVGSEATRSAIGVESVMMILPPQDFGGGNNKGRRRKKPDASLKTTGAAAEADRMPFREALAAFHAKPSHDHNSELSPCHSPLKSNYGSYSEPLAQRRRIYSSERDGEWWDPLDEAEADMIIEAEALEGEMLLLSEGEEVPLNREMVEAFKDISFSLNDVDAINSSARAAHHYPPNSLGDEFVRHPSGADVSCRISGFSQLDHNSLRGMRRGSDETSLPKQLKSTDDAVLSVLEVQSLVCQSFLGIPSLNHPP